ncbi:MAG TPA: hypothetical protein VK569_10645, partial [Bacteroidota bacterium]|nr:hypothetical protein [Bacteroidota bacterium]
TSEQIVTCLARADSLLTVGNVDSAKALYGSVTVWQPDGILPLTGLGRAALAERDWNAALEYANRVMAIDTGNIASRYIAAIAQREIGSFAFREVAFSGPSRYGDWGKSRKEFKWILGRDSSFEDVLYQFSLLLRYEGDRDGALAMDSAQIARKPELVGPRFGRYNLFRYFMFAEDSTDFTGWLSGMPGTLPRYFMAEEFRRRGNLAAAETLFTSLLQSPGDVCPQVIHLALARLRLKQGNRRAAELEYWKAVNEIRSPLGSAIIFDDLKYIVSDWELLLFNSLKSVPRQQEFFRSFWNFRNPSLALKTNLRLQEHIRRFIHAEETFEYYGARTAFNNPDRQHELHFPLAVSLNNEFNDMGLIYIRHGEADDVLRHDYSPFDDSVREPPPGYKQGVVSRQEQEHAKERFERQFRERHLFSSAHDSFESWLYDATSETPRMIFNFQKHNAVGNNWRLVTVPSLDAMIGELQVWDSKYQRLDAGMENERVPLITQMKAESEHVVHYALSTERQTWEKKTETFRFPHAIDVFRAPDGRSLLDVSYAIPLASLSRAVSDTVKSIPVEIGFSLVDAKARNAATQLDTIQVGFGRTRTGAILDLIRYTVPADSYAVSMHIRPLSTNLLGTWRQVLRVKDFASSDLSMSSVQFLKASTETGALAIDGVKVVQSPFRTQLRTEPLLVYFQVYNLVPDAFGATSYKSECILLPLDEADPEKGKVIFTKEKVEKEKMVAEFDQIDVRSTPPGHYRFIVKVTDRKRVQTIMAERELDIVRP